MKTSNLLEFETKVVKIFGKVSGRIDELSKNIHKETKSRKVSGKLRRLVTLRQDSERIYAQLPASFYDYYISLPLFFFYYSTHGTTVIFSKLHSELIQCLESGELWMSMNFPLYSELHKIRDRVWFFYCHIPSIQNSASHIIFCWINGFQNHILYQSFSRRRR